ncbi:TPA: hypothetical protein HA295_02550 [Candidatus Woesearchaeota archaeon]|nr:hypothetical protein [Candidatus Woesearchaeota archaeon]HII64757.1 hypothetical protein [Candidatus Woesearchaeota archaeon]HII65633.1 hypothetical protein [Candidatus Woesearchaeota archaeon]
MTTPTSSPLRTAADDLLDLVRKRGKVSIDELSKALHMPAASVQSLVDFFVEEKILGIEYKFTTPYVYLNESREEGNHPVSREEFYRRARSKGTPEAHIGALWKSYLNDALPRIRQEFMAKASARGAAAQQAEELWQKYTEYL